MNQEALQQKAHSLELSTLALCLLNGEILQNGRMEDTCGSSSLTSVSEFLRTQFFNAFHGPRVDRSLTFNKGCRFINVELDARGIITEGHIWKLGRIVRTADFHNQLLQPKKPRGSFTVHQQRRLAQLADELRSCSYFPLAHSIEEYLRLDSSGHRTRQSWRASFPSRYMRMAAKRLVKAMDEREALRLGSLWSLRKGRTPYHAIFIWEDVDDARQVQAHQKEVPSFVFTASRSKQPNSSTVVTNDIDHHVSLQVGFADLDVEHRVPRLHVKRWLTGLCFFSGCPRDKVIFPWPHAVETIAS